MQKKIHFIASFNDGWGEEENPWEDTAKREIQFS